MECADQRAGRQQQRSGRKHLIVLLPHTAQVRPRHCALSDRARRQVDELVAVAVDLVVEFGDAKLRPVLAHDWQQVTQNVRPKKKYSSNIQLGLNVLSR